MGNIFNWATESSGTIISGLTATAAEYQGQKTIGQVTYGQIRYTFSGSPNLSAVLVGHKLTITGMTTAENNASGMDIDSVDDSADTITILSVTRKDASLDETGASGSGTVTTTGAAVQAPSVAKVAQGFKAPEVLNDAYVNWALSEMASIVQTSASRAQNIYSGASQISSSTYTNLNGAGIPFGFASIGSDQTYTASANDGTRESIAAINLDPVVKSTSDDVLWFMIGEVDASSNGPFSPELYVGGVSYQTIETSAGGEQDGVSQYQAAFGFASLVTSASSGALDFDTRATRFTSLTASNLRAWAIQAPTQDDSSNALVRFAAKNISSFTGSTSFTDMTGYTTGAQTYQSGNKVLLLFGTAAQDNSPSNDPTCAFRIDKDGSPLVDFNNGNTGSAYSQNAQRLNGAWYSIGYVDSVTGSHTYKMQAICNQNSGVNPSLSADNSGYFHAIEIPATWNGNTLVSYTEALTSADTVTSTSFTELATTGSQTFNGEPVLIMLSGHFRHGAFTTFDIRFMLDAVQQGSDYTIDFNSGASVLEKDAMLCFIIQPSAGSHTISIDAKVGSGSLTFGDAQFAVLELPQSGEDTGSAPQVTLTDTTGKKVELTYTSTVNASAAEFGLQITENIDGGGAVADGNEFKFTPPASQDTPFTFRTVVDAPASGSTAVYTLQGKIASGTADISAGDFMARELPGDGT